MNKHYVYLVMSQDRLVVTAHEIANTDYRSLFSAEARNPIDARHVCNAFCIGYIIGNQGITVVNYETEFSLT
jgi:hypothetical protein